MIDSGTLGGPGSQAVAMNDRGQVVGSAENGHAFLWQNGKKIDLGTLPDATESEAVAINNHGQIVGRSRTKDGKEHAVLWTLQGG